MSDEQMVQQALTERQKMKLGLPYIAMYDEDLIAGRLRARKWVKAYNDYPPAVFQPGADPMHYFGPDERLQNLAELFGLPIERIRKDIAIEPPFYCDYGINIEFKGSCYMNFGTTVGIAYAYTVAPAPLTYTFASIPQILDCAKVTIGTRVMFAPGVHIYAATHSVDVEERRAGLERAYAVTLGDDVWVGGHVSIIGPCTIGNGVTIAAGAVVKGSFPDNVVIGGVPARILKHLKSPPPVAE